MSNKLAVITGASRGIGKAVAIDLAKQGFDVALIATNKEKLDVVKKTINSQGDVKAEVYSLDVSDHAAVHAAITGIMAQHHRIDLLFNSAGIMRKGASQIAVEDFEKLMQVNILGVYNFVHAVVPIMKKQKSGLIINMSSMSGKRAMPVLGAYAMSKFAVTGFSEALYKELLADGIKVTTLCPSAVATEMTTSFSMSPEEMIAPEDLVKAVRFVLSLSEPACIPEICIRSRVIDLADHPS